MPSQPGHPSDPCSPDRPEIKSGAPVRDQTHAALAPSADQTGIRRESASRPWTGRLLTVVAGLSLAAIGALGWHQAGQPLQAQTANNGNAQDPGTSEERRGNPSFWQAELRGGHYMVRLDRVASVSRHEYVVDGAARVVEVTVATNSSALARFYYLEPVGAGGALSVAGAAAERARDAADEVSRRTTGTGAYQVVKNYPASTHAHTVEYVIPSLLQLDSLYNSLRDAMETGTGRVWVGTGG